MLLRIPRAAGARLNPVAGSVDERSNARSFNALGSSEDSDTDLLFARRLQLQP